LQVKFENDDVHRLEKRLAGQRGQTFEPGGRDDARNAVIGECPAPLLVKGGDFIHTDLTPALPEN
jgi:hypothetical protein